MRQPKFSGSSARVHALNSGRQRRHLNKLPFGAVLLWCAKIGTLERKKKNKDVTVYRDDALTRRQASVLYVVEAFLHLTRTLRV
ncbi:hypothetical protein MTO96_010472 [Rhipicephalus appendiculatus]